TKDPNPLARLHALWTLEGMRVTDPVVINAALAATEPKIRAAAIRIAEPLLLNADARGKVLLAVMKLADDDHVDVQIQFALTMSAMGTSDADAALLELLRNRDETQRRLVRDGLLSGLRGREMDFLLRLLAPSRQTASPTPGALLTALARCVVLEASSKHIAQLLHTIAAPSTEASPRSALLEGFAKPARTRPRFRVTRKDIVLDAEPTEFLALKASADASLKPKLDAALEILHWPGQPGYVPPPPPPPLTADQQARFERGRQVYAATCVACHKPTGLGQEGLAPPLVDSEWVLGPPGRMIRIVLGGLHGPVTVGDNLYSLDMPALAALGDEDVAAVLTYVRRSWDHGASPVAPRDVRKVRPTTRPIPWTERELLKVNE